jgi:predicted HNH restriction endonuclease
MSESAGTSRSVKALRGIRDQITDAELRMLEAHFLAPAQRITSSELATAAGYDDFRPANKIYSNLGRKLREELGIRTAPGAIRASSFLNVVGKTQDGRFFLFELKAPVFEALREIGWFDDSEFDGARKGSLVEKAALEGGLRTALRRHRHREQSLRRAKLRAVLGECRKLLCEVPGCGFDFSARYGALGKEFAEVHHLQPLADGDRPRVTTLSDLAVVCSNCHSMIHRDAGFRTMKEVGAAIRRRSNKDLQPTAAGAISRRRG